MTVKEIRGMMKLSQSKFANYFKIPVTTLQHWEQGVASPPEYVVSMIMRIVELEQRISQSGGDCDGKGNDA